MQQVGLTAEKSRYLESIEHCRRRGRLDRFMNVAEDRHAEFAFDFRQDAQPFGEAGSSESLEGRAVRLVKGSFEYVRQRKLVGDGFDFPPDSQSPLFSLYDAGTCDQNQRCAAAHCHIPDFHRYSHANPP